jgi:hypothetical protein
MRKSKRISKTGKRILARPISHEAAKIIRSERKNWKFLLYSALKFGNPYARG